MKQHGRDRHGEGRRRCACSIGAGWKPPVLRLVIRAGGLLSMTSTLDVESARDRSGTVDWLSGKCPCPMIGLVILVRFETEVTGIWNSRRRLQVFHLSRVHGTAQFHNAGDSCANRWRQHFLHPSFSRITSGRWRLDTACSSLPAAADLNRTFLAHAGAGLDFGGVNRLPDSATPKFDRGRSLLVGGP